MSEPILRVVLPLPLPGMFDYLPPESANSSTVRQIQPGSRIRVPFQNRKLIGFVMELATSSEVAPARLRRAEEILETQPALTPRIVELCRQAARYYHHSLGEVLYQALPLQLKKNTPRRKQQGCRLVSEDRTTELPHAPKQRKLIELLGSVGRAMTFAELRSAGISDGIRLAVQKKGLIETVAIHRDPQPEADSEHLSSVVRAAVHSLNQEQLLCVEQIGARLGQFAPFLLEGVTGSGKTEVYLQIAEKAMAKGLQTLILVPEIALTHQAMVQLSDRFGIRPALIHSGLASAARYAAWRDAASGKQPLLVGTRSAVFAPLARPGLIVVDEEHDASYKQQDHLRYSARDMALLRGRLENVPVVLGSATPSLETLLNTERKRYQHCRLQHRVGSAQLPEIKLLDIRGLGSEAGISSPLLKAIKDELAKDHQVLLFLNRRGYARIWQCTQCGWIANCPNCDISLTYHTRPRKLLICHYCLYQQATIDRCQSCSEDSMSSLGTGTQQCEQQLMLQLPGIPVLRMDRDQTTSPADYQRIFEAMNRSGPAVLLGTQMIAKGHHFPNLTLAAVLEADSGLFNTDFRAAERLAQLLIQVTGRVGRAQYPGQVILQTAMPEHPVYKSLLSSDYGYFARQLLAERQNRSLPPFSYMALVRAESGHPEKAMSWLEAILDVAISRWRNPALRINGPLPSLLPRLNRRSRCYLALYATSRQPLHTLLRQIREYVGNNPPPRNCSWSLDIDPLEL